MGAYINRDELMELYANTDELDISDYDVKVAVVRQNILDMPTIDLVRCEECEWSNGECSVGERYQGGCTFGERRTDD